VVDVEGWWEFVAAVVVCGGSVIGLALASMLARDGHRVTVLEADQAEPPSNPAEAWSGWERGGVPQFWQAHNLFARFRSVADQELPGLTEALVDAGCVWVDPIADLPPTISDRSPRRGDDGFRFVTGRRPVIEAAVAAYGARQANLTVRRGVRVAGLVPGRFAVAGVPHVVGVRTEDGTEIPAELVVDAMGRRTPSNRWLADIGARPPTSEELDRGFVYYTRYYTGLVRPQLRAPTLASMGSFSIATLLGDNDTWSVTLFGSTGDPPLKALRDNDVFTRVVGACPLHAHWVGGHPLGDVLPMAGIVDRHRRLVADGDPVATGFVAVGDAWACTNPSAGRGISVGIMHAKVLRDVVLHHLDDPGAMAREFDLQTEAMVAPYFWHQMRVDEARFAEMDAIRDERPMPPPDSSRAHFEAVARADPDVFRAMLEIVNCLATPEDVLSRPAVRARLGAVTPAALGPVPGPDRDELLRLLAA